MMPTTASLNNLKFIHINTRSILTVKDTGSRLDHLSNFICNQFECDVLAISESHLDPSIDDSEISIDNYEIIRKDRNRFGGGCMLLIKRGIKYRRRLDLENAHMASIWVEIYLQRGILLIWYLL